MNRKLDHLVASAASLRGAVTHYHPTVVGRGIPTSELDERAHRIEGI